jgi:hypothetical protein
MHYNVVNRCGIIGDDAMSPQCVQVPMRNADWKLGRGYGQVSRFVYE